MIKMFINDEEVVSNKELTIKEEMLATPSTILNNCYPKAWENVKDYVSKFYYPRDYSRCIIAKGFERGEDRWLTYNESGSNINFDTNISLPFKNITIDGKSTQATSTNPVSPSPDYPSEIECVKGKNLFDKDSATTQVGYFRSNGAINSGGGSTITTSYTSILPNTDMTISGFALEWICFYDKNKNFIERVSGTLKTFNKNAYYIRIQAPTNVFDISKIQLEKGTVATNYLPYNTIQVKDVGKNLFDINGVTTSATSNWEISVSGSTLTIEHKNTYTTGTPILVLGTLPTGNYTISGTFGRVISLYRNDTYSVNLNSGNTFASNGTETLSLKFGNPDATTLTYTDIQLEKGTATEFEPYQENTLNINLQGNELCSLPNNVKDELVIENGRAKIIKNVGKVVLNGSENWNLTSRTDRYSFWKLNSSISNMLNYKHYKLCNYFKYENESFSTASIPSLSENSSDANPMIVFNTDGSQGTTVAEWKNWLSTHNIQLYYQLATPIEIDLGEVKILSTFKGVNNVSLDTNIQTNMSLTYLYKNYELIFCGIVKNSGNISLNPRYPHFCDLQILDFKNFLSESDMLDFVISNKTVVEAINMVIEAIKDYGFILGNVNIFGADDIIKAYSTQNKTAYDVFQYLADITGSRWYTRTIDEETVAIDFYDPTLMPSGMNIEYNVDWFEENKIVDLQFNYGSRDYRNKQVMMSKEVFGNINYNETLISNGYETSYLLLNNIGEIVSITINGVEKTFVTNELHDIGFEADFYYTPNKNQLESEDTYSIGTQIAVKYIPIIEGRQVVYNYDEIMRINNQTGRKGIIARYETRNDTTSSKELEKIGETYIKYKGTSEINLLLTSEKDLYNIGQIVYFDSPINELTQSYMVKTKEIRIIAVADFQKVLYDFELTSSFNSEKEINYFDNQRSKNKGNIEEGETITRNIDIENSTEILFNNLSISEVTPTGDNILDCILESPFID